MRIIRTASTIQAGSSTILKSPIVVDINLVYLLKHFNINTPIRINIHTIKNGQGILISPFSHFSSFSPYPVGQLLRHEVS